MATPFKGANKKLKCQYLFLLHVLYGINTTT